MHKYLLFFIATLFFFINCKRDDEELKSPEITIDRPSQNQSFSFGETINISGTVTHTKTIKSIKIVLLDENKNAEVSTPINISEAGNSYVINSNIILNNTLLSGNLHYLCITAHDGLNIKKHFIPIQYSPVPRKKLGIVYLSQTTNGYIQANIIDTLNMERELYSISGEYSVSEIICKYNKLVFAGGTSGSLIAFNIEEGYADWYLSNQSTLQQPWFKGLYYTNNIVYVATQDGKIIGYTMDGNPISSIQCPTNWSAKELLDYDGRFFAMVEKTGSTNTQISQFYSASGQFINQQVLNFKASKFFKKEPGQLLVFGNDGSFTKAYIFYYLINTYQPLYDFGTKNIVDVVEINEHQFLILTTQEVLLFNATASANVSTLCYVMNGKHLLIDTQNNQFLVPKDNQIMVFDLTSGALQTVLYTNNNVQKAHLYYNR